MTEETKLYIDGTNEPYVVLKSNKHDAVSRPAHHQVNHDLEAKKDVARISLNGDAYDLHTIMLTKKDIRNLHKGEALMFFNKDSCQVIAVSKEVDL